jgi:hypothetical protein
MFLNKRAVSFSEAETEAPYRGATYCVPHFAATGASPQLGNFTQARADNAPTWF